MKNYEIAHTFVYLIQFTLVGKRRCYELVVFVKLSKCVASSPLLAHIRTSGLIYFSTIQILIPA